MICGLKDFCKIQVPFERSKNSKYKYKIFFSFYEYLWKISSWNIREVVMLNMIANIESHQIDCSIITETIQKYLILLNYPKINA